MNRRVAIASLPFALLAACATPPPPPPVATEPTPPPAPTARPAKPPEKAKPAAKPGPEVYSRLAGKKVGASPVRPINVRADCAFRDPTGYGARLALVVEDSQVQRLAAEVQVPKFGNCAFALKDFRQTASEPAIALSASEGRCTVRLWEQEDKVTVAFSACQDRCARGGFEYVWPILVDARTGECS